MRIRWRRRHPRLMQINLLYQRHWPARRTTTVLTPEQEPLVITRRGYARLWKAVQEARDPQTHQYRRTQG